MKHYRDATIMNLRTTPITISYLSRFAFRFALAALPLFYFLCGVQPCSAADLNDRFLVADQYLLIPSSIAHVTAGNWSPAQGMPEFILIQDVHKHPEVQSRISSLVVQGYQKWGVSKVFLEGAFSTIDVSVFQAIPEETRELVLNRLIQGGDLSGPELAAVLLMRQELTDPNYTAPLQLIGMEDPRVYRQNLSVYQQVQAQRPAALQALARIRSVQREMGFPKDHLLATQLNLTTLLLNLKMTPSDYNDYLAARHATPHAPDLDAAVKSAERFYQLAHLRSEIFLKMAHRKVPAATGPRILVVGGFHTPAMAELLEHAGRSFVVITPHITQPGSEGLYEKRLMESISALRIESPFGGEMQDLADVSKGVLIPASAASR